MSDGGKGSSPRPFSVSQQKFADNFDAIFRKKSPKEMEDDKIEQEEFDRILSENLERQKRNEALDKLNKLNEELGLGFYDENPLHKE